MSVLSEYEQNVSLDNSKIKKVEGALRWFDTIKGYGFIAPADGSADIMIHNDVVNDYGQVRLMPGMQISCEIMRSTRGMLATKILDVLNDVSHQIPKLRSDNELSIAIVKWYDERKGYGFAVTHDDDGDVMLSRHILRECGIRTLVPGDKIKIHTTQGERGLLAEYIEF